MAIEDDFAVSASGNITYTGAAHGAAGAGYYTTIQFHRWLQDIADDATPATANDLVDITSATPSDRKTDNYIALINGYNIDDTAAEHLFDGSIEQAGGDTIYDGVVVIAAEGMDLQIIQSNGTTAAQIANDFWNTVPNGLSTKGLNRDTANGISHRFMLKVRDSGADIDGRRFIGVTRVDYQSQGGTNGKTFSEFKVTSDRGNNVIALTYADDLNDTVDASTFTGFTSNEGYRLIDVDVDGSNEVYYSEWGLGGNTITQLYQYTKYLSRGEAANAGTLYGIDAKIFRGITHEIDISSGSGTWVEPEELTWAGGGKGQLLAVDDTTASSSTKLWIQILTGVAPTSGTITGNGGASATVTSNIERPVSAPYSGVSTGSALIGGFGFGVVATDLNPSDIVTNLTGGTKSPPLNVTISVSGVTSGEDYILVGPSTGASALQKNQFAVDTGGVTSGATSVTLSAGQETPGTGTKAEKDTPTSGTIRIEDNNGVFQRVTYTGVNHGSGTITFTGCTGTPTANAANDAFISYIDSLYDGTTATDRYTAQYFSSAPAGNRDLFVRVRDGGTAGDLQGIKTFEVETPRSTANASVTAIRTADV